jgi:hypothetical protein
MPLAFPTTVIVAGPSTAVALAVKVSVLVVTPAASDAGLNKAVTPLGIPVGCKLTGPVKEPVRVIVNVSVLLLPRATELVVLLAEMV